MRRPMPVLSSVAPNACAHFALFISAHSSRPVHLTLVISPTHGILLAVGYVVSVLFGGVRPDLTGLAAKTASEGT